jgi:hypothetical protein
VALPSGCVVNVPAVISSGCPGRLPGPAYQHSKNWPGFSFGMRCTVSVIDQPSAVWCADACPDAVLPC